MARPMGSMTHVDPQRMLSFTRSCRDPCPPSSPSSMHSSSSHSSSSHSSPSFTFFCDPPMSDDAYSSKECAGDASPCDRNSQSLPRIVLPQSVEFASMRVSAMSSERSSDPTSSCPLDRISPDAFIVTADILGWSWQRIGKRPTAIFEVEVVLVTRQLVERWKIRRRFSQFATLNRFLGHLKILLRRKSQPQDDVRTCQFPVKKWFLNNSRRFLDRRMCELQLYLDSCLRLPFSFVQAVFVFLEADIYCRRCRFVDFQGQHLVDVFEAQTRSGKVKVQQRSQQPGQRRGQQRCGVIKACEALRRSITIFQDVGLLNPHLPVHGRVEAKRGEGKKAASRAEGLNGTFLLFVGPVGS
ncbi:hypothetical protein GUITHDRAFT_161536 [Guillardia theta CCMP2712]|uniref:PX domain-containing protein n=2 Tax=Guillardia theta TaxID=55529 RepID=L1JTG4_GUITC|nr:hypothetical protein GUITHDRAFT_161536 [Guillardia theta CCMP2712]EKX51490.1 hypothetical protein GUITHDRAFT_161536 [Guillardia theta CCMP2712]|eukprot:XP_005838470.1 hypothetical protein GUITHDRAFT_161536 [Guillardia theta CCMP2712]